MEGRVETWIDSEKTNITQSYDIKEFSEGHDRSGLEGLWRIKGEDKKKKNIARFLVGRS